MKTSEIKELSTPDLLERIDTERTMLVRMKLNHAITPLDNPQKVKEGETYDCTSANRIAYKRIE